MSRFWELSQCTAPKNVPPSTQSQHPKFLIFITIKHAKLFPIDLFHQIQITYFEYITFLQMLWSWSGWFQSNIDKIMTIMDSRLNELNGDKQYVITFVLFIANQPENNGCTCLIPNNLSLVIWIIKIRFVFRCLCFSHFQNVLISFDQNVQSRPENNGCTCYNLKHMMVVIWITKTRFSFKGLGFLTFWEPSPCTAREIYSCTGALLE
jgi:hypothetical protein